jgi:hypothetical protein
MTCSKDRARKDEVERIVGPRDLAHGRIAADIVGQRIEAKTLAIGRRAQCDVVLHVVAECIAKSGIDIFVGVPTRSASVIENHAVGHEPDVPGFQDRIVEHNDLLRGLVFDHRR